MKKAIVTVDLGFGDAGKGSIVDFLCAQRKPDAVIRYCGGPQAGHNVCIPESILRLNGGSPATSHTFSQFGSGTFRGALTYLDRMMIVNPVSMHREALHLMQCGISDPYSMISAHPSCLVITAYHIAMNRLRELARGNSRDGRHGSCGAGVGETYSYWIKYGDDAIRLRDLKSPGLVDKLALVRHRLLEEYANLNASPTSGPMLAEATKMMQISPYVEAQCIADAASHLEVTATCPGDFFIFEGAQGILLDEWYGFHPYTTWSTVTPQHAYDNLIASNDEWEVCTVGITRCYMTRHGAGPLPTEETIADWRDLMPRCYDQHNVKNDWQGALRVGALDLPLLRYSTDVAAKSLKIDCLAVNCLDHCEAGRCLPICRSYDYAPTNFNGTVQVNHLPVLPLPDLKCQADLTRNLMHKVFRKQKYTHVGIHKLLDELATEIAPIAIQGHGPAADSKKQVIDLPFRRLR